MKYKKSLKMCINFKKNHIIMTYLKNGVKNINNLLLVKYVRTRIFRL